MSNSYRIKLFHAIDQLPENLRPDYKNALKQYHFNLEIYVPKNSGSKRTIQNKNYLRNKLIAFNDNLQEEKEMLTELKNETEEFSKQYANINKDTNNSLEISSFISTYAQNIKEYKNRGYNEDKLFPKTNIFERSMLLENTNNYDLLIENANQKTIKKEDKYLQKFSNIFRLNKADYGKSINSRHSQNIDELPLIQRSSEAIRKENLLLKYDVFQTQRTINNMCLGNDSIDSSRTGYEAQRNQLFHSIDEQNEGHNNNNNSGGDHEEIFLSSKGMKIISRNTNVATNANTKTNINANLINNNTTFTAQRNKSKRSSAITHGKQKEVNALNIGDITKAYAAKGKQSGDLERLYNQLSQGKNDLDGKCIKSYMLKYKKKKVEPINFDNGSNLHGMLNECIRKIQITNLPEIIHQFKAKSGENGISESKLEHVSNLDHSLMKLEHDTIQELLLKK